MSAAYLVRAARVLLHSELGKSPVFSYLISTSLKGRATTVVGLVWGRSGPVTVFNKNEAVYLVAHWDGDEEYLTARGAQAAVANARVLRRASPLFLCPSLVGGLCF